MRKSELTILLPPATLDDAGNITSRVYPLVISGTVYTPMVYVDDVHISPGNGVVDVTMTGEGLFQRRHTIGVSNTALPQAAATEMQPLEIRLLNLNPDSAVHVTIIVSSVEARSSGPPVSFGGAVRFRGLLPLGTDGIRPDSVADRDGDKSVIADGPLWSALLTVNDTFEVRNIRDITSQIRVLSPTGTGRIPVTGGSRRVIIVKKDGVTMEVETESLDFRNIFDIDVPVSGSIRILGLLADSIANEVIKNGAITATKIASNAVTTAKIANDAVTPAKLDRAYSVTGHTHNYAPVSHSHNDLYHTKSQMNTALAGKANTNHNHSLRSFNDWRHIIDSMVDVSGTSVIWNGSGYNAVDGPLYFITFSIRGYGSAGTHANGAMQMQVQEGSTWRTISAINGVQFDQGVDSSVVLTAYTRVTSETSATFRVRWIGSSGYVTFTGGEVNMVRFGYLI